MPGTVRRGNFDLRTDGKGKTAFRPRDHDRSRLVQAQKRRDHCQQNVPGTCRRHGKNLHERHFQEGLTGAEMVKVSIVMPMFNQEKYIVECLSSVLRQTLQEIEIIVVNDGSTDNSLALVKEFAQQDDRIVVIDKPNSGYGHSMNVGMDRASGEYIGIVETDTVSLTSLQVKESKICENIII